MNAKSRSGVIVALVILLNILSSCEKSDRKNQAADPGNPVKISTEPYQKEVIDSANRFAFDLFKPILSDPEAPENLMISPFSISSALSMTLNGAAGETYEAMLKALRLDGKTLQDINATYLKLMSEMVGVDKHVVLEIANSVWVEKNLQVKQTFMSNLQAWYKAEARSFDAADPNAVTEVNDWIADKTHDKIEKMLEAFDDGVAMLLINAVYFNGKWRYLFDKANTHDKPFYVVPSNSNNVPMMHQDENLKAMKDEGFTLVDLPYGQGNYSMLIALPDEDKTTSDLADKLTPGNWNIWMEQLENNTHKVDLSLPKFKYGYKRKLNDDLIRLGMGIAFSDGADFSYMCDAGLKISTVLHQSFIETSEEGTEAAAATVVEMGTTSVNPESNVLTVNIDHPFFYFIHETSTGTILFMGKVGDPTVQ